MQLQKPGQGLPFIESLVLRHWVMPRLTKKMSWNECTEFFVKHSKVIIQIAQKLSKENLETKILINRIPGMEDSSRFWSITMVMEHLLITTPMMKEVVIGLSQGKTLKDKVDIAAVKPLGQKSTDEILSQFIHLSSNVMTEIDDKVLDRASKSTLFHPWFGLMTAHQWHWLMAIHTSLHARQAKAISKELGM